MLARIHFKKKLMAPGSNPTFTLTEVDGKMKLNITVELDPQTFIVVPDSDRNQNLRPTHREAPVGVDFMKSITTMQIERVDPADGSAIFNFSAVLDTKLPGTGGTVTKFLLHQEEEKMSQPYETQ